jgi:hypothetical protein
MTRFRQGSAVRRYFVLTVTAIVSGGAISPGNAVAANPASFNALASAAAAGDSSRGRIVGPEAGIGYETIIPVGKRTVAVGLPGKILISQPAPIKGAASQRTSISVSGVEGAAIIVPRSPLNLESLAVSSFCCACVIVRGATCWRSCSSLSSASLARAFAPAISACAFAASALAVSPTAFAAETFSPAAILYSLRSLLASDASCFCNWTTAYVEIPTTAAAIAATPSDANITFSQAWSDKPSIRLTLFETLVFSIVAISCATLLAVVFLAVRNLWRGWRC